MIRDIITTAIQKALAGVGVNGATVNLEFPAESTHGDFATNVAMIYAKQLGKNPKVFAEELVELLLPLTKGKDGKGYEASLDANPSLDKGEVAEGPRGFVERIEIAGPGFINFFVSDEYFIKNLSEISENKNYGNSGMYAGKKILVEHSSPNLFKPFHIGHVMNNTIGESITRLAKSSGADVTVISYPSDVSLGIAKAVYIILLDGVEKLNSMQSEAEKLAYLGECYVRGTKAFEESADVQSRVKEITKHLYEHTPTPELDAYNIGKEINLEYFKTITSRLGSHFDDFIYESEAGLVGKQIVLDNTGPVFTKSEGAVVYEGEKEGLHTRVFINSEGYPTYEAKDIGLMSLKFGRYNPDVSVFITDHEQTAYFNVVKNAAGKINKEWSDKTVHRTHGRMTFKGQKMSSRLGGVPVAAVLLDTIVEEVKEKNNTLDAKTADSIAIGALKFSILRARAGSNIDFDPQTSLSFEGDSGPYLQYTTVRAKSILEKAKQQNIVGALDVGAKANQLERHLSRFPFIVEKSITEWAPHHIALYSAELAHLFNAWYANTKILGDDVKQTQHNVFVTSAVVCVMEKAINMLGISVPEKM
ncbi:MAG: arginine--tRNA ligase [Minisyncoccia bacterium]